MTDILNPTGNVDTRSKVVGSVKETRRQDGVLLYTEEVDTSTPAGASIQKVLRFHRQRCTIAEVNAGVTLLAAIAGRAYTLAFASAIAIGGAASAVTTVDILATLAAASRKLVTFAQASLTQSTKLTDGGAGTVILADGASYTANDVNTAITAGKTGSNVATSTHIDFHIGYWLS